MNNPFSRLKHYARDLTDPQENHATESLAACLSFSPAIKKAFIEFFVGTGACPEFSAENVEVSTQEQILSGEDNNLGYIDLVLREDDKVLMAVEVKVKAPENCDHHRQQLQSYRKWLSNQKSGQLFTLVRNKDEAFRPEQYGAKRKTWRDLDKHLRSLVNLDTLSNTDKNLISQFCDYLESEGIVTTYKPSDLLSYGAGIKAQKAVTGIFSQVSSQLEAIGFDAKPVEGHVDRWPELRIQHPEWKRVFGTGENWKISIWFCVPGIWDEVQHAFAVEFELWERIHRNDWEKVKPKLAKWFDVLKAQKYEWVVVPARGRDKLNQKAAEIEAEPKRIFANKTEGEISLKPEGPIDEDMLISTLVERVKQLAKIIESLS